jgi:hypothetical protein
MNIAQEKGVLLKRREEYNLTRESQGTEIL